MGDEPPRFTVAAVQAAPAFLDREATLDKGCRLIREAAARGARLIVFPETWVPGYPVWANATSRWNYPPAKKAFARLYNNAVDIPGPATEALGAAAREASAVVAVGVNERDGGTLYNTILFLGSDGTILGKHRKLVPTFHERMVWGQGDGSTLQVFQTELGRVSGLVCWEHWMPLARYALYAQGEQLHASLWPTVNETFHIACRATAFEGRLFVIVAASYLTKAMLPSDFEMAPEMAAFPEVLIRGGSAIIGPDAKYLAGPVYDQETILYAEVDLGRIIEEKQTLDVVGHYARPEVLRLVVNREPQRPCQEITSPSTGED